MLARSSTRTSVAGALAALVASLMGGPAQLGGSHAAAAPSSALKVAAAADLALAFREVGAAYEKKSGDKVIFSFGSTGLLEKQIVEGAPFDVFAAANISFAEDAIQSGVCAADSKSLYARGRIVVWWQKDSKVAAPTSLEALADKRFVKVAIANPAHAPYGKAAQQAMQKAGIWAAVQPRLVFGENVQQTLQFAQSGNAEVAVVALSLAVVSDGSYLVVDDALHSPIDQALVTCGKDPERQKRARAFTAFVNSADGRVIMKRFGFLLPGETRTASAK
ncbi:MAG: Molybdenum transporter, periplasmic molybdenum-binding protein ModA [Myxococcales bacterium]|nr:Molybdenum transporter, periplasmic molybdenum-binding protein ModA [Myxococcales bacterium]